jgi:hypothetical protein
MNPDMDLDMDPDQDPDQPEVRITEEGKGVNTRDLI